MDNRRIYNRAKISFPVECTLPAHNNYFYTVSKDLSSGGLKILSDHFIPKGNVMKINLNLIDCVLTLKATVAWCNKERAADRYLTGLSFTEINHENQRVLSKVLTNINA